MPSLHALTLRNVSVSYGPKPVLTDIDLVVTSASRLGIVGRNGSGKSTLLGVMDGTLLPDAGAIERSPGDTRVGLLRQEPERPPQEAVEQLLRRRTGVDEILAEFEAATAALATNSSDAIAERYDQALQRFLADGVADFDVRMHEVANEFGIDGLLNAPAATLSGGQAAKVSLASVVLSTFDLLLLDEPTNDLDFDGLARLERFVNDAKIGFVIVSHDRDFLARTTNAIAEIDSHSHELTEFRGGYLAYLEERALARQHAEERYGEYQSQRQNLAGRAQQQRQWADRGTSKAKKSDESDKFIRHHNVATSEKQAAKAKQTQRAIERLEVVDKPFEAWELHLAFGEASRSGDVVAELRDAVIERGTFALGPVTEHVDFGERVAIVGPNGAGKSTFINALLGRLPLTRGEQHLGPGVIVGEIDQTRALFDDDRALVDVFSEHTEQLPQEARSLLAKFDLSADHVARSARSLSPGERTRATLAMLMARNTNCLVLDEPTNHLDIEAIEQLETALDAFNGTVLLVTHDRSLLNNVRVTRTITF